MPENAKDWDLKQALEFAEQATKLGALVAVFGYMSLRSHFNFIGVPLMRPVSIDRYLMELYHLLSALLWPIILLALPIALVLGLAACIEKSVIWSRVRENVTLSAVTPLCLIILVFVINAITLKAVNDTYPQWNGVVTGTLRTDHLPDKADRSTIADFTVALFYVALAGLWICRCAWRQQAWGRTAAAVRSLWMLYAAMLILLLLQTPILFGISGRSFIYNHVRLRVENHVYDGYLLLEDEKEVTLWQPINGYGRIQSLPRDKFQSMITVGADDILQLARTAAQRPPAKRTPPKRPRAGQKAPKTPPQDVSQSHNNGIARKNNRSMSRKN